MPTNYNEISSEYEASTHIPFRECVEEYTFFKSAPDFQGKRVLDLACGEGRFPRKIKQRGASQVVGVDKSEKMILLAKKQEEENPQGITYVCKDVTTLSKIYGGNFDIASAVYLLNYADNLEVLKAYCRGIFLNLKPGGTFVAINANMHTPVEQYGTYRKYDLYASTDIPRKEGMPITFTLKNPDDTFVALDNYYLSPETYEQAFEEAGFIDFQWTAVSVSPEGVKKMGEGYWDHFIKIRMTHL